MDCMDISSISGLLTEPEAEVKAQSEQVVKVSGILFCSCFGCGKNEVKHSKGGSLLTLDRCVLGEVDFKMLG